jgi:DNA-binding MarR family transcriptional regulator
MPTDAPLKPEECNCLALRQAARHVTQFYDRYLTPLGVRTTQFSILAKLRRRGPLTINALAEEMVMDRTTLGRNVLPLQREGLIAIERGRTDRRSKELRLTDAGTATLGAAVKAWAAAQSRFDEVFGPGRASQLRGELRAVTASDLEPASAGMPG